MRIILPIFCIHNGVGSSYKSLNSISRQHAMFKLFPVTDFLCLNHPYTPFFCHFWEFFWRELIRDAYIAAGTHAMTNDRKISLVLMLQIDEDINTDHQIMLPSVDEKYQSLVSKEFKDERKRYNKTIARVEILFQASPNGYYLKYLAHV